MSYLFLVIGLILLVKGADFFVDGSSSIAKSLKIPTLIIGLTIVAFGTSAPEAAVSITASLQGKNDIAIGNVVGSNIFNLLFVIGVAASICKLNVQKSIIAKEFPFAVLSCFVLLILSNDSKFQNISTNSLTKADGLMLLVMFGIFMYYLIELALVSKDESTDEYECMPMKKSILFSIGGLVGIVLGGQLVVDSASDIALTIGMSQSMVGLTIVAIGTSLPELVTSIVAAKKGESDIALGNVIGSNLFNIFFILGISAFIHPIGVNSIVFVDMILMFVITLIAYIFAITKRSINKIEGNFLILFYIMYMAYIIIRE